MQNYQYLFIISLIFGVNMFNNLKSPFWQTFFIAFQLVLIVGALYLSYVEYKKTMTEINKAKAEIKQIEAQINYMNALSKPL